MSGTDQAATLTSLAVGTIAMVALTFAGVGMTKREQEWPRLRAAPLSGKPISTWLPVGWTRRLIMLAIVAVGLQQAWVGNYRVLLFWLLLPFFSPRIVGECAYALGVVRRN